MSQREITHPRKREIIVLIIIYGHLFSSGSSFRGGGREEGGGTLYNGITGQAPPERGYLFHASRILMGRDFF